MWIINSHWPFIHKLNAEVRVAYTLIGIEEARALAQQFNNELKETEENAKAVRAEIEAVLKLTQGVEKRSPHYNQEDDAGIG